MDFGVNHSDVAPIESKDGSAGPLCKDFFR
jgi:hypothetical protein